MEREGRYKPESSFLRGSERNRRAREREERNKQVRTALNPLMLSMRTHRKLQRYYTEHGGLESTEDLFHKTPDELLNIVEGNKKAVHEISTKLEAYRQRQKPSQGK